VEALHSHSGRSSAMTERGLPRFNVRDDLKRTWSRETRLNRQEKGLEGTTPQLSGKHAPPAR
jgi:hypothetical protein